MKIIKKIFDWISYLQIMNPIENYANCVKWQMDLLPLYTQRNSLVDKALGNTIQQHWKIVINLNTCTHELNRVEKVPPVSRTFISRNKISGNNFSTSMCLCQKTNLNENFICLTLSINQNECCKDYIFSFL